MQPKDRANAKRSALSMVDDLAFQRGRKLRRDGRRGPTDRESREWLGYMVERSIELAERDEVRELVGA